MKLFYQTASIHYSIESEQTRKFAEEKGVEYSGHSRIVTVNVGGNLDDVIAQLEKLRSLRDKKEHLNENDEVYLVDEGQDVCLRGISLGMAEIVDETITVVAEEPEEIEDESVVEFALAG